MDSEEITPPEISPEDILTLADDAFHPGHVGIVTGAASGIGEATAIALAENGLSVIATDVDADGLEETVRFGEELGTEGPIHAVPADLADDGDMDDLVETAAEVGSIRYLANIAGLQHVSPLQEFPMDRFDTMQAVMARAPMYLSKLCIPHFRNQADGRGCVGNMSSVHGHYVTADKVAYNMSKFAIRGLTQSIAAEGEGDVRAFSVSTGYVATPLVTKQIPDTAEQRGITPREVVEDVMLGQARNKEMMAPIDVANLFAFGFSDRARHLNGGDLMFDGGMTLTYE